jgi:hypothetical protein
MSSTSETPHEMVGATVRTWCDACDGSQAGSHPEAQNQRNSARFGPSSATCGCEPGVRRQVRTVAAQNPRDSAAFDASRANLSATGATVRFAPCDARKVGILRLSSEQVRTRVRTANPLFRPVASEKSRGAPRIRWHPGRTPRFQLLSWTNHRMEKVSQSLLPYQDQRCKHTKTSPKQNSPLQKSEGAV